MSIVIYKANSRGRSRTNWLDSWHSFSFDQFYDPSRMNFGALRVLNDDIIAPDQGFGTHSHANMEIVTIVLNGELQHKDSTGGNGVITVGEVQRMSAGIGVHHSEFNASKTKPVHLLQVWISPKQTGIPPSYEQKRFNIAHNALTRVVDGNRRDGAVYMHQNGSFFLGKLGVGERIIHKPERSHAYLFVITGSVTVNGHALMQADAAGLKDEKEITITAEKDAEVLLIEVPPAENTTSNL